MFSRRLSSLVSGALGWIDSTMAQRDDGVHDDIGHVAMVQASVVAELVRPQDAFLCCVEADDDHRCPGDRGAADHIGLQVSAPVDLADHLHVAGQVVHRIEVGEDGIENMGLILGAPFRTIASNHARPAWNTGHNGRAPDARVTQQFGCNGLVPMRRNSFLNVEHENPVLLKTELLVFHVRKLIDDQKGADNQEY